MAGKLKLNQKSPNLEPKKSAHFQFTPLMDYTIHEEITCIVSSLNLKFPFGSNLNFTKSKNRIIANKCSLKSSYQ